MLKVLYGLKNFEGKSKFKTWLYSITYNECITQYRKERRKRRLMDALSLDPLEEASEEKAPKPEEKGGLDRWLVHVNPIDREILVLRFVAELEFQEIADIMHMGLSATKMRYKRALDKLREKFAGELKLSSWQISLTCRQVLIDLPPSCPRFVGLLHNHQMGI
jgi:RNA polymerase sigma-70 factor (ECF subfamily)